MLGSVNQLAVTVGLLLAFVMGALCKWRWLAFVGALPSALLLVLMFSMPETPRWFLGRNRRSEALRVLLWLRGPDVDIEEECAAIEATLGKSQASFSVDFVLITTMKQFYRHSAASLNDKNNKAKHNRR